MCWITYKEKYLKRKTAEKDIKVKKLLERDQLGNLSSPIFEFDREVIVLVKALPEYEDGLLKVSFGHRSNPDGWYGKNIITGKVSHFQPKTYGKGGWSLPNAVYWLDLKLPINKK